MGLDAGILPEDPCVRRARLEAEQRLSAGIVVVRLSRLGRKLVGVERLDLPAAQQLRELACLVWLARSAPRSQAVHRTSATSPTSASRATRAGRAKSRR